MAEGSTGAAVHGSRQLSITHSRSLKGCLQCSCPVSLCFAVPYFILSMLKHCSNASIAAHAHSSHTQMPHKDSRFARPLLYKLIDSLETNTIHIFLSLWVKIPSNPNQNVRTEQKTFCANKEKHSAAVKHNTLFLISLLCQ